MEDSEKLLVELTSKAMECKTQAEMFGILIQAYHRGYVVAHKEVYKIIGEQYDTDNKQ